MQIRDEGLSERCSHQAKRCLLDYLGATYAGGQLLKAQVIKLLNIEHEIKESGVKAIGFKKPINMQTATFINGLTSHVAEMDDGVRIWNAASRLPNYLRTNSSSPTFQDKWSRFVDGNCSWI